MKISSTVTVRILLENEEVAFSPIVDTLSVWRAVIEEAHYFLQEIGSVFDKPGCALYKSSCVCLASEQGLWDVSSLL